MNLRTSRSVMNAWLRLAYGLGRVLTLLGVRPNALTLMGLLASLAVPVVAFLGGSWLLLAAVFVLLSMLADSADGAVAVIGSRATRLGAFYDAVADRVAEAAWLLALWVIGVSGPLLVVCGGLAWLHEYARARAATSGMTGVGVVTVAERPTRASIVGVALVLGALAGKVNPYLTPGVATVVVAVWFVLGIFGARKLFGAIRTNLQRV